MLPNSHSKLIKRPKCCIESLLLFAVSVIDCVFKYKYYRTFGPWMSSMLFYNFDIPGLFPLFSINSIKLIINVVCRWMDSNRGSVVLEVAALPTEPNHDALFQIRFSVSTYLFLSTLYLYLSLSPSFVSIVRYSLFVPTVTSFSISSSVQHRDRSIVIVAFYDLYAEQQAPHWVRNPFPSLIKLLFRLESWQVREIGTKNW